MAGRRLLLVMEASEAAADLQHRLITLGYETVAVPPDDADLATMVAADPISLALVDIGRFAEKDRLAPIAALREAGTVTIVFMGPEEQEAELPQAGVAEPFEYLVPPFRTRELRVNLELALSRHGAGRAAHELEAFFAVSLDMFCFLTFNGYLKRLNPAWEQTLGFTRAELMSRPFIEFVHPDDRERTLKQNAAVRAGGQAKGFENRYLCSDGSYRWFLWNATPLSAGEVIYSAARDITARKEAEAERAKLVVELEASLAEVRSLQAILPTCMYCRKIRDDADYWHTVENYISAHTDTRFSHSICPHCMETEVDGFFSDREGG